MQIGLDFNLVEDLVAGVDEVGRGPLCGAVVTAAVILDPNRPIAGLNDSKKLTEARREKLYDEIREKALSWCIARAEVEEIDELNILHATMLAMQRAVEGLSITPKLAMIDGNRCPRLPCRPKPWLKAIARCQRLLQHRFWPRSVVTVKWRLLSCNTRAMASVDTRVTRRLYTSKRLSVWARHRFTGVRLVRFVVRMRRLKVSPRFSRKADVFAKARYNPGLVVSQSL